MDGEFSCVRQNPRKLLRFGLLVLAALIYASLQWQAESEPPQAGGATSVERAYAEQRSGVMLQFEGDVGRVLSDDNQGSRHQRFIVELTSGHTMLVAHNIDLAERVPLRSGDRVVVFGEYEWNDRGGVVHWTHHDPRGHRPGGWIRFREREYR